MSYQQDNGATFLGYSVHSPIKNPMSRYTFKRKLKAHLLNELAVF